MERGSTQYQKDVSENDEIMAYLRKPSFTEKSLPFKITH